MTQRTGRYPMAMLLAVATLTLAAGSAQAHSTAAKMPAMSASAGGMAHGSDAMNQAMMSGMKQMQDMKPSGNTDKDFAMMMKVHHQQALDMAQMELEHGKSPAMKAMARKIITAQKKEIAEFDQWMKTHP